jgi:hypothetical protein
VLTRIEGFRGGAVGGDAVGRRGGGASPWVAGGQG